MFLKNRNYSKGDNGKELTIYYPKRNRGVAKFANFIDDFFGAEERKFDLEFIPLDAGDDVVISDKKYIKCFKTIHGGFDSLGYAVHETRSRLKPEYKGQDIPRLIKEKSLSPADFTETYEAKTFAYTLDAYDFDWENVRGADYLVADCTFIDKNDRRPDVKNHYALEEVVEKAKEYQIKNLIAAHISLRYDMRKVREEVAKISGLNVLVVDHSKVNHF